jgi:hypothetical protein
MARIGGLSAARNSCKLRGNQVFSDGDDAANIHSGEVTAWMPKTLSRDITSPNKFRRKPTRPSVVPSVQRVNRANAQLTRRIPLSAKPLRIMSHKLDILQAGRSTSSTIAAAPAPGRRSVSSGRERRNWAADRQATARRHQTK